MQARVLVLAMAMMVAGLVGAQAVNEKGDYVIGPGDVLRVEVFGEKELSGEFRVAPSGNVALPQLGNVKVGGLTLPQVQEKLKQALAKLIRRPAITVGINELASERKIYVAGRVEKPGIMQLPFGSTVLDAIIAAGVLPDADLRRVTLTRPGQAPKVLDLSGWRTAKAVAAVELVRYGDTIFVPELTERISVLGAVAKPATIVPTIGERLTLLEAIARGAGGLAAEADPTKTMVIHKDGTTTTVNLRKLFDEGDMSQNIELRPGDVVVVTKAKQISVVGQVSTPGVFTTGRPVPILVALAKAGQILPKADLEHAKIVSSSGTREINLKAVIEKGEQANEITLQPGDVLVIPELEPQEVLITGAVTKAGVLDITDMPSHDLLRVLTMVGLRPDSDATKVCILRDDEQIIVDYKAMLENAQLERNVELEAGDVVYVPSLENVYVLGAVANGGRALPCPASGISLLDALVKAGGMSQVADVNQVHVVRLRDDGKTEHVHVRLGDISRGKAPPKITLKPGDIVYVGWRGRPIDWRNIREMLWTIGWIVSWFR